MNKLTHLTEWNTTMVVKYMSINGACIRLTVRQVRRLQKSNVWPKDKQGQSYSLLVEGLHVARPTYGRYEFCALMANLTWIGQCDTVHLRK